MAEGAGKTNKEVAGKTNEEVSGKTNASDNFAAVMNKWLYFCDLCSSSKKEK
jgi:hypothetical protein